MCHPVWPKVFGPKISEAHLNVIPVDAGGPSASADEAPGDWRSKCHPLEPRRQPPEGVNAVAAVGGGVGDSAGTKFNRKIWLEFLVEKKLEIPF